ncbi:hypothetical protein [Pseudomonas arsenicoxydans]|uniref:Uncharacterized protein n=1 Tax=Pseudomonas arsenicoxydans TaxID=702115 RepID=A0A502HGM4_9PSED|nr:hypothetical protein [Pseudomonas arsenicoxydans]TPG73947.1 hypothetical protein EAH78_26550 [Pseudomonas arsenicoxydans]
MSSETRQRLVTIITDRVLSGAARTINISDLATAAGISRQAFHRYYSDLKPYANGTRPATELLDQDFLTSKDLLSKAQLRITELTNQLNNVEHLHAIQLRRTVDQHITSLMNNDLAIFEADSIRSASEKQSLVIADYVAQIQALKTQLAQTELRKQTPVEDSLAQVLYFEPKLNTAYQQFQTSHDIKAYEAHKDREMLKIAHKINALHPSDVELVIYIDKYISQFSNFKHKFREHHGTPLCVVRAPVYDLTELQATFLDYITSPCRIALHVPQCESSAAAAAQRAFFVRNVPAEVLNAADHADHFYLRKGIEQVTYFLVRSGE